MQRQPEKINVLFIIKPERSAGAEMVLVEAAARLDPDRFRVICGLLTPDAEGVIPPHVSTVDFRMPGLNGWVWLRFFHHFVRWKHAACQRHSGLLMPSAGRSGSRRANHRDVR